MLRAVSVALASLVVKAEFQVVVNGVETACVFKSQSNNYGQTTRSVTKEELWTPNSPNYDLKYQRVDATNAEGGRCQTGSMTAIRGSGTFEAEIYIHSNVRASTGVFTVAALPETFDATYELDLFVINLGDDIMKSGRPQHTQVFKISDYEQKWVKVKMVKTGGDCSTSISSAGSGNFLTTSAGSVSCNLSTGPNHIVINVRARDGGADSSDHSFISIRKVSWTSASEEVTNNSTIV